jgi:hypothetical protein
MRNWAFRLLAGALVTGGTATLASASAAPPRWHAVPLHTKALAEQNVLRTLPQRLSRHRLGSLLDQRTALLKNNVQVVCRGVGPDSAAGAYHHFRCTAGFAVRPSHRVVVSYVARSSGRFRIRAVAPNAK